MIKKVLITGKNGYISNALSEYLKNDERFYVEKISLKNDEWQKMDFSKYDTIIHLAAIVHKPKTKQEVYLQVNYDLTIELAKKAKDENVKQFIFFSTASVYGDITGEITENTKEVPSNFYGKSKLMAEIDVQKMETEDFKVCIVRPPMVYGKGCKGNYNTLAKIAKKSFIFPKIQNKRSMIYIENLCEFTKLLLLNCGHGKFFPQNKEFVNTSEMVKLIASENNHKILITRLLNPFVFLGRHIPGKFRDLCNKAFGDWYYVMEDYPENYNIKTFEESIRDTEN